MAMGRNEMGGFTVPAINIRGLTYASAQAVYRAVLRGNVGAFIFEIARSEIGYTEQRPAEYTAAVLAAAIKTGYSGPVFLQGDHFQISAKKFAVDPVKEVEAVRELIVEAVRGGFYNIDIDSSTVVDLSKTSIAEQQENIQPEHVVAHARPAAALLHGSRGRMAGRKNSWPIWSISSRTMPMILLSDRCPSGR